MPPLSPSSTQPSSSSHPSPACPSYLAESSRSLIEAHVTTCSSRAERTQDTGSFPATLPPSPSQRTQHIDEPASLQSHFFGSSSKSPSEDACDSHRKEEDQDEDDGPDSCLICLTSPIEDRSILPQCLHSLFCFQCIVRWSSLKRQCPLCARPMGAYILHAVRSEDDYVRYFLRPDYQGDTQRCSQTSATSLAASADRVIRAERSQRTHQSAASRADRRSAHRPASTAADPLAEWDRSVAKRRFVYRHGLYAMHIGANRHTGFKPPPLAVQLDPSSITASASTHGFSSRRGRGSAHPSLAPLASFIRREVFALPLVPQDEGDAHVQTDRRQNAVASAATLDVDFTATYILSVLKTFDVRSEETVKTLAEYFSGGTAASSHARTRAWELAEHFTHEVMTFLRSGAKDCAAFDVRVVYPPLDGRAAPRRRSSVPVAEALRGTGQPEGLTLPAVTPATGAAGSHVHPSRSRELSTRQCFSAAPTASSSRDHSSTPTASSSRPVATDARANRFTPHTADSISVAPAKRQRSTSPPPLESSADAGAPPQADMAPLPRIADDLCRREELLRRLVLAKRMGAQGTSSGATPH